MVLIQKSDPKIATLLKAIDTIVDDNRVSGLRSFGVLVTDESDRAVPILQTMAFDEQIRMPLTASRPRSLDRAVTISTKTRRPRSSFIENNRLSKTSRLQKGRSASVQSSHFSKVLRS